MFQRILIIILSIVIIVVQASYLKNSAMNLNNELSSIKKKLELYHHYSDTIDNPNMKINGKKELMRQRINQLKSELEEFAARSMKNKTILAKIASFVLADKYKNNQKVISPSSQIKSITRFWGK